ncbi:MAG: lipocalin [Pseudomonadota bacterium]
MTAAVHRADTRRAQAVYRFGAAAVLAMVLAGCVAERAVVDDAIALRNPTAPIGVTSRYDDARFAGPWFVRGVISRGPAPLRIERRAVADDVIWRFEQEVCATDGGPCRITREDWRAETDVPGADLVLNPNGGEDLRPVVVWIDEGYRTAAVGDAAGRFAWVLDRAPQGGADRIAAAQQVLAFSGFDPAQMRMSD